MNQAQKKRSLSGIRSSGNVHIGNYLGMIKPALEYQKDYDCLYFIADLHALTTLRDKELMHQYSMDLVATWLALGLDVNAHTFYRQSDVPFVTEYAWYLSCFTNISFLEKAHAYKDARANNKELNHGVLAYPILMAADIVMYDVDIVPVGKDQKQHVEMARDFAGTVNAALGQDVIKLPEPVIREEVMTIPGLDGRKMSKSYNNEIPLFCPEKQLRKKIMSIKTDSTDMEAPKELDGTLIGDIFKFFGQEQQYTDLKSRLAAGGMGWGHAKEELFQVINDYLKDARSEYDKLRQDEAHLISVLDDGARKATEIAVGPLNRLRSALGFKEVEL
ncbi:MAG: tryptophan--tRNA ligase [Deltaproteobacteria bacterium]|nr:tryptophan--tRNA ligase [Deltaproteobacteria bacterium]